MKDSQNQNKVFDSFKAPLHIILRRFKTVPIIVLFFFSYLTWDMTVFYKSVALELKEWAVVPILGYLGTLIASVKYCLDAIRLGEQKDEHDE